MPIKPENRHRYPRDWRAIRERIRARAGDACEGTPQFPHCRAKNGEPHPETGSKVVCTTAHMNHQPEDCRDENLRFTCQRCHLAWDAKHHARTAWFTRRAKQPTLELFALEET